jgi:hypothetical protein
MPLPPSLLVSLPTLDTLCMLRPLPPATLHLQVLLLPLFSYSLRIFWPCCPPLIHFICKDLCYLPLFIYKFSSCQCSPTPFEFFWPCCPPLIHFICRDLCHLPLFIYKFSSFHCSPTPSEFIGHGAHP